MPRFRRSRQGAPITSSKNILDLTATGVAAGVTTDLEIVSTVNDYTGGAAQVPIGAHVKNVWISYSYNFAQGFPTRMDMYICKQQGVLGIANLPVPGNTTGHTFRRQIFLEIKGLGSASSDAFGQDSQIRGFSGWVHIPKRFQRMGEDDKILMRMGSASNYNVCVKAIYKMFT